MTDIARIGVAVETGQAVAAFNNLKKAAAGVTTASEKMSGTLQAALGKATSEARSLAAAELESANKILKKIKARQSSTAADKEAAKAARDLVAQRYKDIKAEDDLAQKILRAAAARRSSTASDRLAFAAGARVSGVVGSSQQSSSGLSLAVNNGVSNTTPRDMMPNRFNTANIAAQFQDIGVTAAMGMNPLIIAMQQGTQIAAIANSMMGPNGGTTTVIKGLSDAFKQIINPMSLMAIGVTGVVAALIQWVNWSKAGETALNLLAGAVEYLTPVLIGLGAALLYVNLASIVTAATTAATAIGVLATAAGAATVKFALMAAAWATTPFGMITTVVTALVAGVEYLTGWLGKAADAIRNWAGSAKKAEQGASGLTRTFNEMTDKVYAQREALKLTGKALDEYMIKEEMWAKEWPEIEKKFPKAGMEGRLEAIKDLQTKMNELAGAPSIQPVPDRPTVAGAASGETDAEKYAKVTQAADRRIETLKAEQAALGMTAEAAAILKYQTDLLNDASEKKINLDTVDIATGQTRRQVLMELGAEMGKMETSTKRQAAAMEFAKDAGRGFFNDMKQGLQEGKSLWESFGNAVTNVLNKIFDKIMNSGIEMLFDGLFPSGSGGILGGSGMLADLGNFLFSAKGNAFNSGGVQAFAKGGAFTNSIVNRTTPFAFAGGGAFGVMGEAGPEAVMPLHRGPDGSLGVKMAGGGGGGTAVIININNNTGASVTTQQRQTSGGLEIDVMVDQMVSQKIAEQGSDTNRSLEARDSRRLISR